MGVASDPMLELDKGVKPAIDKVVEMGVADANRVAVFGHSYGGYTVYGLITQTQTFKAAVAFAGITDLVSMYGRFDSRYRFSSTVNPLSAPASVEAQQSRMGVPPWEDPERYVRNSPFFSRRSG
jgi:dipeptidyl aminopeptidase/acylaminoacyl peptidase